MKATTKKQKCEQFRTDEPEKKSRSVKDRPQNPEELHAAVLDCRLDNRTRQARELVAVRERISADPVSSVRELCLDLLAGNVVVRNAVLKAITAAGTTLVDKNGDLHPLLKNLWPQLHREGLSAAQTLLRLEATAPGKGKADAQDPDAPLDVSTLVLELSESSNK